MGKGAQGQGLSGVVVARLCLFCFVQRCVWLQWRGSGFTAAFLFDRLLGMGGGWMLAHRRSHGTQVATGVVCGRCERGSGTVALREDIICVV